MREKIEAKCQLESTVYYARSAYSKKEDAAEALAKIEEVDQWMQSNPTATKAEYEQKQTELSALLAAAGPPPPPSGPPPTEEPNMASDNCDID